MTFQRTILITGSTDGLGRQAVIDLAKNAANFVIVHGRSKEKCEKVVDEISTAKNDGVKNVGYVVGDFSKMSQVKPMADEIMAKYPQLNVLVCNAGVLMPERHMTEDGFELTFQVNHLAHFYLTHLLLPLLKANQPSRIISVSSICHDWHEMEFDDLQAEKNYEKYAQYSRSKLANHMFTFALARRLAGTKVTCNVLEPGVVETKLLRNGGYHGSPVEQAAPIYVYLSESDEVANVSDKYYSHTKKLSTPGGESRDEASQEKLWVVSEEFCKKLGLPM